MKKLFTIVFFALFLMLTFVACSVQTSTCEHQYITDVTKQPTCIAEGERTRTCTLCGEISTEPISTINHRYTSQVTATPTCKATGVKTYTCSGCGDTYTENIAKTGHNYSSKVTTKATCKATGVKTYTCSGCGDSYTEDIAKTGHNYSSKVTTKATCSKSGTKTYTCEGCGDSYTQSISATGHSWVKATCTKPKTCTSCKTTSGSALGHDYNYNGKCTRCGSAASATIVLPSTPKTISYYGYNDKIYTTCKVTKIQVDLFSSSSSGLWYEVTFWGTCTYNKDGNNQSSNMQIGYKLYDSDDYVVDSGTVYSESVTVGEKFKETIDIYYLEPGKTYTLVISNVN